MLLEGEQELHKPNQVKLYSSTSRNKVLLSLNYWLFFDWHIRRVLFRPPRNGCNSSCTRQTTNLCWHSNNTSCHQCLWESQQLCIFCNSKGSHLIGNNDSTSKIWMHYYSRYGNSTKYWAIHDHHWLFSRLFMSLLQGDAYKVFGQAGPISKLQASILHLHCHM